MIGRIAAAGRFQLERQRRHAVAAAARPRLDALFFHERGFERLELARFHLREGAKPAIHIEALRLVTPLQLQPLPRLRFVERAQFLVKALMPALVVMLVELAAERVEPGNPRQNGDQAGGAPSAPLALNALCLPRRVPPAAPAVRRAAALPGLSRSSACRACIAACSASSVPRRSA